MTISIILGDRFAGLNFESNGEAMEHEYVDRWCGEYFGWIEDNQLFTKDGRHIAQVLNRQIYSSDGRYLGEYKKPAGGEEAPRLITKTASIGKKHLAFVPQRLRTLPPRVTPMGSSPLELPDGYEDFPEPDSL